MRNVSFRQVRCHSARYRQHRGPNVPKDCGPSLFDGCGFQEFTAAARGLLFDLLCIGQGATESGFCKLGINASGLRCWFTRTARASNADKLFKITLTVAHFRVPIHVWKNL
jgi:hypothetical protein